MIDKITYRTLSSTLKEMESDDLVHREEYPPQKKGNYSLTKKGQTLRPIIPEIRQWREYNKEH